MTRNYHAQLSVGRLCLWAPLLLAIVDFGSAFVSNIGVAGSRSFVPRSLWASQVVFDGNEGGLDDNPSSGRKKGTHKKNNRKKQSSRSSNGNSRNKQGSRPASFAAIRKEYLKDNATANTSSESSSSNSATATTPEKILDGATIAKIARRRHLERKQEQEARRVAREERRELKLRMYELSVETERGFRSNPEMTREMTEIIDRLAALNPTTEPAWSYYGKSNPLTRQLYQSMASEKKQDKAHQQQHRFRATEEEENCDLASLEGKWILTYTDVPSIVDLATESNKWGFAKLGRIGQECTPFPDYTVRTIIEWKRPDWVRNLSLPHPVASWLFGREGSSVLQKTTLKAKATPDDPSSWGVSTIPQVFEVVSSRSSTALYDDDDENDEATTGHLSLVTDDGLLALDPLQPLRIGLQMAGRNDAQGLFLDEEEPEKASSSPSPKAGSTKLVTKNGLVALNPFQPWTVGLQIAGFARRERGRLGQRANEPWKIADDDPASAHHRSSSNIFEDIQQRGLIEGVLKQSPIQLPGPASLLEGDDDDVRQDAYPPTSQGKQRILYLDDDIRIIGDGNNHVTIESRACTDKDEECWF